MKLKKNNGRGPFLRGVKDFFAFNALPPTFRNIVFYSESGQDWHHLSPYVRSLVNEYRLPVTYITSDVNDPAFTEESGLLKVFFIKNGFLLITLFQTLKADVVVLTMIDLHRFQLRRSVHPVHYIYLFHAMGSTHMVDFKESYDHYDTVFCAGPHQIREIRAREQAGRLPQKNCVEHGYARVEELYREAKTYSRPDDDRIRVLLAPTWGPHSIVPVCGRSIVKELVEGGFCVVFRPHYQTVKLAPRLVDSIVKEFGDNRNFMLETKMGDTASLFSSDLLICDWSSTAIEYALGLGKPVVFIDVPPRVRNPDYRELGIEPMEMIIREKIGIVVSPRELSSLPEKIYKLLQNGDRFREHIETLRGEIVFNFGSAVATGTQKIAEIAGRYKNKGSLGALGK